MIVTGDVTQIDLPEPTESGLIDAARRLRGSGASAFITLDQRRHRPPPAGAADRGCVWAKENRKPRCTRASGEPELAAE